MNLLLTLFVLAAMGIFPLFVLSMFAFAFWARMRFRRAWRELGALHGLTDVSATPLMPSRLEGEVRGVPIAIGQVVEGVRRQGKNRLQWSSHSLPESLHLAADSSLVRMLAGDDQQIGDPGFDEEVRLHGDPGLLIALLDADAREHLRQFIRIGGRIEAGRVVFARGLSTPTSVEELDEGVRRVVDLVNAIARPGEGVAERLGRIATSDPLPAVRRQAREALFSGHPQSDAALSVAEQHRDDSDPDLRARARWVLAEPIELAELVTDPTVPGPLRGASLTRLARVDPALAEPMLEAAVDSGLEPLILAAIEALSLSTLELTPDARAALGARAAVDLPSGPPAARRRLAPAVLELWEGLAGSVDEAWLLPWMSVPEPDDARRAGQLLGALGTAASVGPLQAVIEAGGAFDARSRAAEAAIARIQARIGSQRAGQLTVADGTGLDGGLSTADEDERGRLARAAQAKRRT